MYALRNRGVIDSGYRFGSTSGWFGKRFVGYFSDDVSWFNTATLQGQTNTTTQILNFSSSADDYSWMWVGTFKATSTGTWTFYTSSDDASYLWVGDNAISGFTTGNAIVDNGGLHGVQERSGTISLTANVYYPIRVMFGERGGGDIITVQYAGPSVSKTADGSGRYFDGVYAWDEWVGR